uniref:Piwi domain-containing protein n=1 Tax=Aegilops tauschii subsp. strangulata TaxID=200361 RepID=A0A453KH56_AEGTS
MLFQLVVGNSQDCVPFKGRWNYNNKKLFEPVRIERWAIVNFSARCDMSRISRELINCGRTKGIIIEGPYSLVDEDNQARRCAPIVRVERMFEKVKANLPGPPEFLLCVLPERKNCDIYGPWKKKNLHEMGIVTQCIVPSAKMNDQYFTNVLLKINAKLGGMNSKLALEHSRQIPVINKIPTIILGMDVSHGSPGRSDIPSIAAVVGSRCWPLISRYRASVRTQSPKVEMIDSLFKPLDNGKDDGIIRELLLDFYTTSQQRKPEQIIIFRDGVSESQFSQVLNLEVDQIIKAYQNMGQGPPPKITVIIAQKNHHTKLFQADAPDNVPAGTVVDKGIVHPKQYDFYMCAHAGPIVSLPVYQPNILEIASFQAVCDSTVDCVVICQALFGILNTVELVAGYAYYHQLPNCVSDFSCAVYIWHPKYCEMFAPS